MPRRSKARVMQAHCSRLLSSHHHESSRTATYTADQVDMADKSTPGRNRSVMQEDATNVADRRQQSEKNAKAWKEHIYNRIVQPVADMGSFMTEFVHSEEPIPDCPDAHFMAHVPTGEGKVHDMYVPLVDGLTSLVREFDDEERPEFFNHAHKVMQFPFALCAEEQHVTKPDVVATIPGPEYIHPLPRWRHVALVFEVKPCDSDDPMKTYANVHEETLIQLAKSARNIMLAQGRLYAFVVGIYGAKARIFRFDRAGAVCSPLFNYIGQPQILHEFLWRFMHPPTEGCVVLGDDPTSTMGTHEGREQVQELVEKYDPSYAYTSENRKAVRRLVVTNEAGREIHYLAYKLIFINTRLFSRATMIWEAFELGDENPETGRREGTGKHVVIKEAWRQFARPSEIGFYRAMREAMEEAAEGVPPSLTGIAEFEYGDDLGLREARRLEEMAGPEPKSTDGENVLLNSMSDEPNDPDAYPRQLRVPYWRVLGHRTVTARCRFTEEDAKSDIHEHNERGQMRLVLKTIGTPITEFSETYELVTALRDAIEGHRQAYVAGVIHRDVSKGNVMIARRSDGSSTGFIHDFDYASSWKRFLDSEGIPATLERWVQHARSE
ncbi:hypothetical protein DAEQUDRAFT_375900 [Daedalea quercina L-15889]|uniref:Fungal-type protein kinase domain-containing protein n=1 Tax=Daedalea quercina L-15889 TaxID=1314783 RepID=A0A165P864_9APHY|nr:hypothetical protein DAEQUDRAFT_375900 [Daedalea quercina L-15889]